MPWEFGRRWHGDRFSMVAIKFQCRHYYIMQVFSNRFIVLHRV